MRRAILAWAGLSLVAATASLSALSAADDAPPVTPPAPVTAAPAAPAAPIVLTGIHLTNDRTVDCTSDEAIFKAVVKDDMTDQQKAISLWRFYIQRNMHKEMSQTTDDGNSAELMTKTGYGLCGNWGHHLAQLAATGGLKASSVYLNGHVVAAINYWGGWHMLDADMWALYPKADGVLASPDEIRHLKTDDGKFLLRSGPPVKSFPWYEGPDSIKGVEGLYDKASVNAPYAKRPYKWNYNLSLRPGETISWSWYGDPDVGFVCLDHLPFDDCGKKLEYKSLREYLESDYDYYQREKGKAKWNWGNRRGGLRPNPLQSWNGTLGNGRVTFDLTRFGGKYALLEVTQKDNLALMYGKLALADAGKDGSFTLDFAIPYSYGDAWVEKEDLPAKGLTVEYSLDGKAWEVVFTAGAAAGKAVDDGKRIRLFDLVRGHDGFQLKFTLAAGSEAMVPPKAVGAFVHTWTCLPGLLQGANKISLAGPDKTDHSPWFELSYDYVSTNDDHVLRFYAQTHWLQAGSYTVFKTSEKHWPLMREIRLTRIASELEGGLVMGTGGGSGNLGAHEERDWGALPWDWCYSGVNWWNDFERGDRQGWAGQLDTENTYEKSDFCLKDNLMSADGHRQLKFIRFGAFLNRDTKFACKVFVKNVKEIKVMTRHQDNNNYYSKTFASLKDGEWQPLEFAFSDLTDAKNDNVALHNGDFLANVYLQAFPADGKTDADVEYRIDNTICYDGELKHNPFTDPDAAKNALKDDPIWNAKPPAEK